MNENLKKFIKGECTAEEFKKAVIVLAGLMSEGKLHDFMHWHWKGYDQNKLVGNNERFKQILDQIHHNINITSEEVPLTKRLYRTFSKVAAIVLLPLLITLLLVIFSVENENYITMTKMETPGGMQSQIKLPDGTLVWLNSESEIYFPASFKGQKKREVKLIGEAYFQVATDKRKPFIVTVDDGLEVKVTGTSFNLSAYRNEPQISLALVEGSVIIRKMADDGKKCAQLVEINPGEVIHYQKESQKIKVLNEKDLDPYIAWKEGKYVFVNESFDAVLRTMERKFNVQYIIDDPDLLKYRITATFFDETLEEFLKIITASSPIAYEIKRSQKAGTTNVFEKRIVILTKK